MITQFAQMFSTNGVLLHGTRNVLVPGPPAAKPNIPGSESKSSGFNQAATQLNLSPQALARMAAAADAKNQGDGNSEGNDGGNPSGGKIESADAPDEKHPDGSPLSASEKKELHELKQRDKEVHVHEQAHQANAGSLAKGGPQFDYQKGPDGRKYAIGGHVDIDSGAVPGNPEATLRKADAVQRAAMAPGEPSGTDKAVAAAAARMASQASQQLNQADGENGSTKSKSETSASPESEGGWTAKSTGGAESEGANPRVEQVAGAYAYEEAKTGSSINAYA